MNLGTPKTFDEAVTHAICFRPPKEMKIDAWIRGVFRDYFAQKFGVALLRAHTPEQQAIIKDLWKALFGEDL